MAGILSYPPVMVCSSLNDDNERSSMPAKLISGRMAGTFDDILRTGLSKNVIEVLTRIGNQMKAIDAIPGSEDEALLQGALDDLEAAVAKMAQFKRAEVAA